MSINSRIKKIRKDFFNDSNIEFAKALNKSKQYASNLTSEGKSVGKNVIENLTSIIPDLNVSWLLTGEGEMLKGAKPFRNEVIPIPEGEYMMVEYVDLRASAGKLGGADVEQLPETHRRLVPKEYSKGKFLVVGVDGDSMNDGTGRSLTDGDEVLIYQHDGGVMDALPIRKTLFVITTRDGNVLKQITEINRDEQYIVCHSFNPAYEDFKINFDDIYQIFIVCKIVQKQISLI